MPLTTPQSLSHQQGVDIHLYTRRVQLVRRVPRNYETQTATFSVTANGSEILYCEYYREHSIGQKEVFHPNTTYYDMYMGTILTPGQPEWGCLGGCFATKSFTSERILLKSPPGTKSTQPPAYSISGGCGRDQSRIRGHGQCARGRPITTMRVLVGFIDQITTLEPSPTT